MADRYWTVGHNMGYAGTGSENKIDACEYLGYSEEDLAEMDNSDVESQLAEMEWQTAVENVDAWANPIPDK